jgi:hypothetical protein
VKTFMRKTSLVFSMLFIGVLAFVSVPAFAEYDSSHNILDQVDHTGNSGMGEVNLPAQGTTGLTNQTGFDADDNGHAYGPETIVVPYTGLIYNFAGCDPVLDENGAPVSSAYGCGPSEAFGFGEAADLIIQDVFGSVVEGDSSKGAGNRGITQYFDSLIATDTNSDPLGSYGTPDNEHLLLSDTLDQELADLAIPGNGIYQRLHVAFSRLVDLRVSTTEYDEDGIDQTVEAYVEGDNVSHVTGVAAGKTISYMAQWFQKGAPQDCTAPEAAGLCDHTEFGGHSDITSTPYVPDPLQHDP